MGRRSGVPLRQPQVRSGKVRGPGGNNTRRGSQRAGVPWAKPVSGGAFRPPPTRKRRGAPPSAAGRAGTDRRVRWIEDDLHPFDLRDFQRFSGQTIDSRASFLNCWEADRLACSVGRHPSEVWPEWWCRGAFFSERALEMIETIRRRARTLAKIGHRPWTRSDSELLRRLDAIRGEIQAGQVTDERALAKLRAEMNRILDEFDRRQNDYPIPGAELLPTGEVASRAGNGR